MRSKTLLFFALFGLTLRASAATETITPSATATPSATLTATLTVTPASGSYSIIAYDSYGAPMATPALVNGSTGNSMDIIYVTGEPWALGGGNLTVIFPPGMDSPNSGNFWVVPALASRVLGYSFAGHAVTIQLKALDDGMPVTLRYGQNATGYGIHSTLSPEVLSLYANPQSVTLGAGGQVPVPLIIPVYTPTVTPTVTPTFTVSPTFSISPTFTTTGTPTETPDWTHTVTPTETPLAAEPESGRFFCYPNPFDQRIYDKMTIRFKACESAEVQIFNLLGEPVRTLDAGDIEAAKGWAIWHGEDDRNIKVVGGLYFARLKTPDGVLVRKFTVLR